MIKHNFNEFYEQQKLALEKLSLYDTRYLVQVNLYFKRINRHHFTKLHQLIKDRCCAIIGMNQNVYDIIRNYFNGGPETIIGDYYGCNNINLFNYLQEIYPYYGMSVGHDPDRLYLCTCANPSNHKIYIPVYLSDKNECEKMCEEKHVRLGYDDLGEIPCDKCSIIIYDNMYIRKHEQQRYLVGVWESCVNVGLMRLSYHTTTPRY